jgi:hypothetical protein
MPLPKRSSGSSQSIYAPLGLKDLPFPTEPVADPYSYDERRNGTIYAESPVRAKIEQFEQLLIRPNDFSNRVRLAYLWAKGDQQSGRGMGKTALLRYFRQRINKDWGNSEFSGQFSAVVVYIAFTEQIDRRHMEQLALSALYDICKNGVLDASRAVLRLEALTEEQADVVLNNSDGRDEAELLNDDALLQAKGIETASLDEKIARQLIREGVDEKAAIALAQGQFEQYLRSFRRDGNLKPFYVPRDTKILDYSRKILFDDMVKYLRAAGFAGGYLFIDDIENLVDQMARKQQIEFAKEFAICTVRPGYANTAYNFFSCVLTTHQQASVRLAQAWADAGLAAIARLDPASPNSVELPLPSKDQAREILVAHLDYYRANPADKGTIKPFTEDGIEALLRNRQLPRIFLADAAKVIQKAVREGATTVNAELVNAATTDSSVSQFSFDFTEGIDSAL